METLALPRSEITISFPPLLNENESFVISWGSDVLLNTEYLSWSNTSNTASDAPKFRSFTMSKDTAPPLDVFETFLVIFNLELVKSTLATFELGNGANKVPWPLIKGAPKNALTDMLADEDKLPSKIPPIPVISDNVNSVLEGFIDETLLNVSDVIPGLWNLTISFTFIPENIFPPAFIFVPLFVMLTVLILLGNLNFSRTVSAAKVVPSLIDLISWTEWTTVVVITLGKSTPLICICSPFEKVPEVWLTDTDEPEPSAIANPLAPLLLPLMKDPAGNSVELSVSFNVKSVLVWISNNLNSHLVESSVYGASSKLNE